MGNHVDKNVNNEGVTEDEWKRFLIDKKEIDVGELIVEGSNGVVYSGIWRPKEKTDFPKHVNVVLKELPSSKRLPSHIKSFHDEARLCLYEFRFTRFLKVIKEHRFS